MLLLFLLGRKGFILLVFRVSTKLEKLELQ